MCISIGYLQIEKRVAHVVEEMGLECPLLRRWGGQLRRNVPLHGPLELTNERFGMAGRPRFAMAPIRRAARARIITWPIAAQNNAMSSDGQQRGDQHDHDKGEKDGFS